MPENGQQIRIPFAARADAAVMGTLADKAQGGGDLEGIMFTSNFQTRVVGEDDLEKYTSLRVGKVKAKVRGAKRSDELKRRYNGEERSDGAA